LAALKIEQDVIDQSNHDNQLVLVEQCGHFLISGTERLDVCQSLHFDQKLFLLKATQAEFKHFNLLVGGHELDRMAEDPSAGITRRGALIPTVFYSRQTQ